MSTPLITDSNQDEDTLTLIADAVHRIDHRTAADRESLAEIRVILARLLEDWERFRPVAEAFGRGGVLAARKAARRG